jgi:membrane carboxypeptidase/penicillin-binding protein
MRVLGRIILAICGLVLVAICTLCSWLYLYSADLPSIAGLYQYDPAAVSEVRVWPVDEAHPVAHVVPSNRFGNYIVKAAIAAEGQPEARRPIRATISGLLSGTGPRGQMYSWRIARELVPSSHAIRRQIDELRLAERIQGHFDQRQIMTIYLNRVYLGDNTYGAEDGALRYFGKHLADLSLDEAALLAGLIRSPAHDSPFNHPERAVQRRNSVLAEMMNAGSVSTEEGKQAQIAPLIVKQTADSEPAYDRNRCALKLASRGSPVNTTIRARSGEKPTKYPPVIAFEILESGEIRNAVVRRSSGIADIDNYALSSVKAMKYYERPLGCGIIDSQAVITIDFF